MNETISTVLREHADGDIHIERLLGAVHAGARRHRRRRLAVVCGVAVLALGAVAATGTASSRQSDVVAGPSLDAGLPRPPRAEQVLTAGQSPDVLGSDPSLFHLDVADLAGVTDWKNLSWSSTRSGHEELNVALADGGLVRILADRNPDRLGMSTYYSTWQVTVGGKPAEARTASGGYAVTWQPRPGIWAGVEAPGSIQLAIDIAERLRLGTVYRCAVPFRLAGLNSARMVKCETDFLGETGRAWAEVWVKFGTSATEYEVAVGYDEQTFTPNDTIDGRPVQITQPTGDRPLEVRFPDGARMAYVWVFPFQEAVDLGRVRSVVAAYTSVGGDDPRAWPANPLVH